MQSGHAARPLTASPNTMPTYYGRTIFDRTLVAITDLIHTPSTTVSTNPSIVIYLFGES